MWRPEEHDAIRLAAQSTSEVLSLHRQLEELLESEEGVEITPGRPKDRHINLFSYAD